ncbi:tudor and KH domain-containing protein homolog isoform X2 [Plutella xylostella]|uniref:tudor and KH domain-containing protein homolog isoform X2 n=1 Tax=Plutella xylostella TaxID=51655 RepID=UPI002032B80F|nr:tudor and KH domain-containing protein homolog isoform X2 [Plutella xylostella]
MSFARLAVPVALGLSLATVTAFVVYYVFKKDEEESEDPKASRIQTSRATTIEVSVPKSIVPALIGRSGSNIKDIEKKSGAMIHFKKFSDKDHDVCIIRGAAGAAALAEAAVLDCIRNQPVIVEDDMTVPSWACGRIIGTGGESITDISHRSGARVKVEGVAGDAGPTRRITFKGTRDQIALAKGLVQNCIAQEKCRREIEQAKSQRSPRGAVSPPPAHRHDVSSDGAADMPEVSGAAIEVYVSAVSSPSRFWVQFVGPQVGQLDALVDHMTEYYGHKDNRDAHKLTHVSVGQVVAAVFRHDGRWYRARVADIRPNEFDATQQVADVFYVDYGDSEYVATHELCELRADLLRLRFQAMECFLAGVRPAGAEPETVWSQPAVERFEELTQVARWKPLVSKTCTYKKALSADDKEREIPGIKLYDVTDEGEVDIAAALILEGWAADAPPSPRASPARATPTTPFGDLGKSSILGMFGGDSRRSASLPRDRDAPADAAHAEDPKMPTSQSLASGLESSSHARIPSTIIDKHPATVKQHNGTQDFIQAERNHQATSSESLEHQLEHPSPVAKLRDEFKANMNRIDSHHSSLEALGKTHELQK